MRDGFLSRGQAPSKTKNKNITSITDFQCLTDKRTKNFNSFTELGEKMTNFKNLLVSKIYLFLFLLLLGPLAGTAQAAAEFMPRDALIFGDEVSHSLPGGGFNSSARKVSLAGALTIAGKSSFISVDLPTDPVVAIHLWL